MFPPRAIVVALSVLALTAIQARAAEKEKEPDAILEIGGSGDWSVSGPFSFGPTAAIEFTPIENWLEIEVGTGPMFGKGISGTDILFKKPFTLSDKVEFMIGAGPQWSNAFRGSTKAGAEIAGISCFGRGRIENSDGFWSLAIATPLSVAVSSHLA
jgi:hypothetical protein